jgi:hypothetical protein
VQSNLSKILTLAAGMVLVFAVVAVILLQVLPGPHQSTDYLVVGTLATFVSLLVLFVVLTKTWVKVPDLFGRKREK